MVDFLEQLIILFIIIPSEILKEIRLTEKIRKYWRWFQIRLLGKSIVYYDKTIKGMVIDLSKSDYKIEDRGYRI